MPSSYDINKKFLQGIPTDTTKHLLLIKNMSAELTSFNLLVESAMEYESGELFVHDYLGSQNTARTVRSSRPQANAGVSNRNDINDRQRESAPRGNPRWRPVNQRGNGRHPPFLMGGRRPPGLMNRRPEYQPRRDAPRGETHAEHPQRPQQDRQTRQSPEDYRRGIICFACGQKGHYATDTTCPKFSSSERRPALRMAHVVEETSEADGLPESETDKPENETEDASPEQNGEAHEEPIDNQ